MGRPAEMARQSSTLALRQGQCPLAILRHDAARRGARTLMQIAGVVCGSLFAPMRAGDAPMDS